MEACPVLAIEVPGLASQVVRMSLLVYTSVIGTCVVAHPKASTSLSAIPWRSSMSLQFTVAAEKESELSSQVLQKCCWSNNLGYYFIHRL